MFAVFATPALWLLFRTFPEEGNVGYALATNKLQLERTFPGICRLIKCNRPFGFMVGLRIISGIGMAGLSGSYFFWFDGYLDIGASFTIIMITMTILAFVAPMVGIWLTNRFSRLKVYVWAAILSSPANATLFFLTPDTPFLVPLFVLMSSVVGAALSMVSVAIFNALFADVVDYGRLKAGVERAGLYLSVLSTISKAKRVLLGSIGLVVLGLFGFESGADSQPDQANMALRVLVSGVPFITSLSTALIMIWFPLNKRRMEIINKRLVSLNERKVRDLAVA